MNRKNLEMYNRVPVLESLFVRRMLAARQILLLVAPWLDGSAISCCRRHRH